jgi:IMP dehydrogenase/GMP reductase
MNTKFDFDDILIQPEIITDINSRTEVNPFYSNGFLPLITAPMDTVVNTSNCELFYNEKINICLPRGEQRKEKTMFQSYSLSQFKETFLYNSAQFTDEEFPLYVLIDTANGHTEDLVTTVTAAKHFYEDKMVLMVGNIAHPESYKILSNAGADLIRIGIGNGGGCLTTQQLGIGYPMGSLISECYAISCTLDNPAKIVADGGMKKYADIIKALALGADYVMVGSIFNKALESAGENYGPSTPSLNKKLTQESAENFYKGGYKIFKMFRGMSTKEVQKAWGNEVLKTSEGVVKYQEVEYTIGSWTENFEHYLRSAMSYTNSLTLEDFIGKVKVNLITEHAFNRFNK